MHDVQFRSGSRGRTDRLRRLPSESSISASSIAGRSTRRSCRFSTRRTPPRSEPSSTVRRGRGERDTYWRSGLPTTEAGASRTPSLKCAEWGADRLRPRVGLACARYCSFVSKMDNLLSCGGQRYANIAHKSVGAIRWLDYDSLLLTTMPETVLWAPNLGKPYRRRY